MRHLWLGAGLVAGALVNGSSAWAQSNPSSEQILKALQPTPDMLRGATRGIRMPGSAAPAPVAAPAPAPAKPAREQSASAQPMPSPRAAASPAAAPSVDLVVEFKSGSAELSPQAVDVLNKLGQALANPSLTGYRFKIAGHTDTVGSAETNQTLSERRAVAVAGYLSSKFGIDSSRLQPVGMGASDPAVPTADQTPEPRNRRVQVVNLGT